MSWSLMIACGAGAMFGGVARAQAARTGPFDIEVPVFVEDVAGDADDPAVGELDLANVVQSAARSITTVQEAPAIVTVVPGEEIADRQYRRLEEIFDAVPGWMRVGAIYNQFPTALVRGQLQAVQFLHDGTSLFDPVVNIATLGRTQPVETIKRVELVTGPGGVLWGANSLVGILNVITKDAADVDGLETGVTLGDGPGDRRVARAYVMYGDPQLGRGARLFLHGSFETFDGPGFRIPDMLFTSPTPQPNSAAFFGPMTTASPGRSYLWTFDGKLTLGRLQLRAQVPFVDRSMPIGFPGNVTRAHLGEDTALDPVTGRPACPAGVDFDPGDRCVDRGRKTRVNGTNYFDRYLIAEYRTRLAGGAAGVALKGYAMQFGRRFAPFQAQAPTLGLLEGGIAFTMDLTSYRLGTSLDGDVEAGAHTRLLYGVEAFREFMRDDVTTSRQGPGVQATFLTPYQLDRLPLPCPRTIDKATGTEVLVPGCPLTAVFPASRTVFGAYLDPQLRFGRRLIVDGGVRVQVAPASLGRQSYAPQVTGSGAVVAQVAAGWHVKASVAQGFRPPVFNNVASNGESVQVDGRDDLRVETSRAEQAELNGRIFRGERQLRELSFRVDASHTTIRDFIQLAGGRYGNTADRDMRSVELLAKLYVQGGHRLELGYTWLRVDTADRGVQRALPEHWFHLGAVMAIVARRLSAIADLRVVGAFEDPNRMVEYRDTCFNAFDQPVSAADCQGDATSMVVTSTADLVFDRLPASADLTLGLDFHASERLRVRATVANAFDATYYQPDPFSDYDPRFEMQPNPAESLRAYVEASYRY